MIALLTDCHPTLTFAGGRRYPLGKGKSLEGDDPLPSGFKSDNRDYPPGGETTPSCCINPHWSQLVAM